MSATEALASRYRHLFVLPSTGLLLVYAGAITVLLCLIANRTSLPLSFALAFSIFLLSSLAISSALQTAGLKTIANARRIIATLIAGGAAWLFCAACGAAYAFATGSQSALTNAILVGAFVCAGLEFLIINGVFVKSTLLSLLLAAVYPAPTFTIIRLDRFSGSVGIEAWSIGALAFVIIGAFVPILKRKKTSRGHNSLDLFRSFMRTWVGGDARELEGIIAEHSETTKVVTKVMRLGSPNGDIFIALPGIHPGPFFPLGSYDLPGVISRAFEGEGKVMTLHRAGGHERNLVAAADAARYASTLREFSRSIQLTYEASTIRGPASSQIGKATINSWAFQNDLVATISFAPLGSDDLSSDVEKELGRKGAEAGLETWVVDAHNSIAPRQEVPDTGDEGWQRLFGLINTAEARHFRAAYSNSMELGFHSKGDLTENGIGLLMLESGGTKWVLALADSNNAVPPLRAEVAACLESSGYKLIEFCTSDTHNLAAKGLTVSRGYKALGEETPVESIAGLVTELAKLAEARLSQYSYGSGELTTDERVFGSKALKEFATMTQSSSELAKRYFRFAASSIVILIIASLLI